MPTIGTVPVELDELEEDIKEAVDAVARDPASSTWRGEKPWTRAMKNAVGPLGKRRDFYVYARSFDAGDGGEWLYDMTWLKYSGKGSEALCGLPLAMEIEWGCTDIDDFQKLILARADHRVFVFDGGNFDKGLKLVERMRESVHNFAHSASGDRYLIGTWDSAQKRFAWTAYVVR